jgi:hypothetical protein
MKPEVGRRVFVGSVVAGLPLLATAGSRLLAQSTSGGGAATALHNHGAIAEGSALLSSSQVTLAQSRDPINNELQRQLKLLVPQVRKGRHAAARQVAGLMRISSVQAAHALDAQLKVHLRRAINEYGKSGFLINHGYSHERLKKELAEYGVSPDQLPSTITYATKERVLDALLASGLSAYLTKVAEVLDIFATQMETRGPLIPVALQAEQNQSKCQQLWGYVEAALATLEATCGAFMLFPNPVSEAACAFAAGALSALLAVYFANCWLFG